MRRVHGAVEGTVQGVGFRPYVYRLASELHLGGFVGNDERGVVVEVEGEPDDVDAFLARLPDEAPPLAHVERVLVHDVPATGEARFAIVPSARHGAPAALVVPDAATCDDCLAELFDPADRRHRYPFINCTNCGPRFTIVRDVPYDRPRTTMAGVRDVRRLPAPSTTTRATAASTRSRTPARPAAPSVAIRGQTPHLHDAVADAAALLRDGAIVAVKGLGGYHLACRADDERGGRGAARAQAPRGPAVRADGRGRCGRGRARRAR